MFFFVILTTILCLSVFKLDHKLNIKKLHQHRPQTATNHVSTTFMRNKEFIGCPIPEKKRKKRRETSPGTQARNQKEPENHDGTQSSSWQRKGKNRRETSRGTLAGTRRKEEIMMEHNATILRRQAPQPFLEPERTRTDGTECQKTRETDNPRNPARNQEMKMEQNAKRLGRQSPEPYPKPKGLRKWWWNRMAA